MSKKTMWTNIHMYKICCVNLYLKKYQKDIEYIDSENS